MQFKKQNSSLKSFSAYPSNIEFVLQPHNTREALRIELSPFQWKGSVIRVTDAQGVLLMESDQDETAASFAMEYTVEDMQAGIYYFEVNDGFYYQVKEVRVPAA